MSSSKRKATERAATKRVVYSEFGTHAAATERAVPDLPPGQQTLRLQVSRKGRKGKTVTLITGFQTKPETLATLLKQLKSLCGAGGTTKDMTLEIQGDHREQLAQKLAQLGYTVR